jgi:TetR/AcrR family transcriptional regulator
MMSNPKSTKPKRLGSRGQPEATREAILKAAGTEFAMEGLSGARMDAIAHAAHVNKALLYYYFHDKDALYGAVLDGFFRPLFARLTQVLESSASPGEKILGYARTHFDSIAETPHYARLFQSEMMSAGRSISPHLSEIVDRYTRPLSMSLQSTLKEGVECGQFRQIDVFQFIPSMVASIVFYFVTAPVQQKLRGVDPFSPPAIDARRTAVLDFIAAALFADREEGLQLAAQLAEQTTSPASLLAPVHHHPVAARGSK